MDLFAVGAEERSDEAMTDLTVGVALQHTLHTAKFLHSDFIQ